jgi:ABC-type Mn2+/Zn2+ transport system permease subunit
MLGISVASAVLSAITGLFVSYFFNVAAGATIVLVLALLFVLALSVARSRRLALARPVIVHRQARTVP